MKPRNWMLRVLGAAAIGAAGLLVYWAAHACCPPAEAEHANQPAVGAKSLTLRVEGMTCASCSVTVRMALKKVDGVKDATVSVVEKRAVVEYDPAKLKPDQIAEAVSKAGYRASVASERNGS